MLLSTPRIVEKPSAHTPEGTVIKSTGEGGGTKYLREDGDGTSSWQTVTVDTTNLVTSVSGSTGAVSDGDIDHDSLANFAANEHFTQANITATGTVASGTWQGTAIDGTYVDLEGTELKSTGEAGGTKYLREDGDGTCSWQTAAGGIASVAADGSPQLGGFLDANGNYMQTEKGGDIASASPLVIDTDGDYFDVTGTTNFAAMTVAADRQFTLQFDGALTMTHHATNLDLPGEANITTAAGDVAVFQSTGANTVQCINYTKADGTGIVAAGGGGINDNVLINGEMRVAVRGTIIHAGTTFLNDDDSYSLDRWNTLSDGDDIIDITQAADGGVSGTDAYINLDVETAQKKFGIAQYVENDNCRHLLGGSQVVSLSFEARVSNATRLSDIRAAVLSWDSTEDSVTSDIVSAWGAEGSNFTPVANWTLENTPANLSVTTSWAKYTIENISIDTAATANLCVFIWQNNVATNDTVTDTVSVTKVKLELGASATTFVSRDIATERTMTSRYCWNVPTEASFPGRGNGETNVYCSILAPVRMFATPTSVIESLGIVAYATGGGVSASSDAITGMGLNDNGNSINFKPTTFAGIVNNEAQTVFVNTGEFWFVAEM